MLVNNKTRLHARLNSAVMLLLLTVVVGLLAWLSQKHVLEYDWTATARHSLSEMSQQVLNSMPHSIEITSYARRDPLLRDSIKKFVGKYQYHKNNIHLRFINPDAAPDNVRKLGIKVDGEMVIHYQGRSEHVSADQEQVFTNALQRLARDQERQLVFIEGHGERSISRDENHDLSEWVKLLTNKGYRSISINLTETQKIPTSTNVLVITGPGSDYLAGEVDIIKKYIDNGGNLLWLHEPGELYGLDRLNAELGIKFYSGAVIDYTGQLLGIQDPTLALITKNLYEPHPITTQFEFTTLFPIVGAIDSSPSTQWLTEPILRVADHAWLETGHLYDDIEFNQDEDTPGPLTIGVSLERELETQQSVGGVSKQQRIVVIADGDFLSNLYLESGGNSDLGVRIINWLSSDDEFISIPNKAAIDTKLTIEPTILAIFGIAFLFGLPITLVSIGIVIGIRRKKQ